MTSWLYAILTLSVSQALAAQPSAPSPIAAPLRDITFGQLNFLHTTDTHGWHAGHLQEPSYSADWGDYISFAHHLREKAEANGQDLLLVDTGDRIEGNGLFDASDPKGKYTYDIFKEQHIDVICTGNHELYKQNSSENEYLITVPNFKDNYLASNLDILDPATGELVPLAPRFKKFTTKIQGIRVVAFGFLFDFRGNANNTVVQPVEKTVDEPWFQEAISDREVDLFLVIGHVPVRSPEYDAVFKKIRGMHWDTPIMFFGGHTHVRDYVKYDSKSYALESGRFMETIGFQSIDGLSTGNKKDAGAQARMKFSRMYIDNNLYSFYHHSGLNSTTFDTEHGTQVSKMIDSARDTLKLDRTYGCAEKDLWMFRAKYPSNNSIFTWIEDRVIPDIIEDEARANIPRLVLINTGAFRFDIFRGPFTRDSMFIVSPFTSGFRFLKDVPYEKASKILTILNHSGPILQQMGFERPTWELAPPEQRFMQSDIVVDDIANHQMSSEQRYMGSKLGLTPGYTTKDDAGVDGDDTIHSPISFYRVPNCIQSMIDPSPSATDPETVDLVYVDFIEPWVIVALKFLGLEYSPSDISNYMEGETLTSTLAKYVIENWKDNC